MRDNKSKEELVEALKGVLYIVEHYRVLGKMSYEQELTYQKALTTLYKETENLKTA